MAQSSEIKLNKRFDQNIEITGTLTVGGNSVLTSIPVPQSGNWWNLGFTRVGGDGVMEIGKYLDWHDTDTTTSDYTYRMTANGSTMYFSGSIAATGYNPTDWDTAYGWGDHDGLYLPIGGKAADSNLLDGIDSSNFFRTDGTYPNTDMNTTVEGYWHVASGSANLPVNYYGHRWDYDHIQNGQWVFQMYSPTSGDVDLWFRQKRDHSATTWQKVLTSQNIGSYALTSYTETDTLATVTARGATTSAAVNFSSTGLQLSGHWFSGFYAGTTNYIHLYPNGHSGGASVTNIRAWNGTSYDQLVITGGNDSIVWRNKTLIHSGNIGSQSVSNSDTVDGYHASGFVRIGEPTFSANTAEDTSGPIEFIRDTGAGWDDYIIKHGPTKGMFGKKGVGWHADSSSSFHVMSSGWVSNFGVDSDGTTISRTSSRAPVFYDYNDSNYYLDPNSSSVLNNLNVNGYIHVSRNNTTGNGIILADDGDIVDLNDAYLSMRFSSGVRIFSANRGGSVRHTLHSDGNAYFNTSARSPIFYDNNDTNYYVDPNSTSVFNAANFGKIGGFLDVAYTDFYVYGDENTYYPVIISGSAGYGFHEYSITRGYGWTAPWNPIGTGAHKGGLTFNFYWSGDTAWGGNDHNIRVKQFTEQYTTMVAGLALPVTGGVCVWLRGGGSGGAMYRLRAPRGHNHGYTVYDGVSGSGHATSTTFTAANGATYSARTNTNSVSSEIHSRYPVRGTNEIAAGSITASSVDAGTVYGDDIYTTGGWFRNHTNTAGIYWSTTGWHLNPYNSNDFTMRSGSSTESTIRFSNSSDTTWSYIHSDANKTTGFLNNSRSWISYTDTSGNHYSVASSRAPIYYDKDNTGYYMDLTTTGSSIVIAGSINFQSHNKPGLLLNSSGTGSAGAAFGMQQVTAEGWTGIFVDYEPYTGWGLYHDNPNNYFCITAESSTGNIRSFTVPSRVSGNRTAYEKIRFDQNNGNIITGGALYSTAIYDQDNTGYYLNPNGTSSIYYLTTGDTLINHTRGGRIGFTASGNHTDGFPYARIGEAWGVNMSPPDSRWAPSVTNASFLVGSISGGANYGIGNIRATGDIVAYASDKRLKRNIKPITNALNKVINMNGVYYDWDLELCNKFDFYPPEKTEAGVLAQEVQEVFPEVVQQAPFDCDADENGNVISKSGETYLTVKYEKLVPLLIEAVKELSNKVEELENKLNGTEL